LLTEKRLVTSGAVPRFTVVTAVNECAPFESVEVSSFIA
jgi:hypothetical protein